MKCPECNTEINKNQENCPNCGAPIHNNQDEEPTIGKGMVIFIIVGTIFLIAFGAYYYSMHKNDPDITQTAIEPDSNLAEKNTPKLDTIKVDTISKDSIDKQEKKQAEKILNSVRGRYRSEKNADGDNDEQSETSETEAKPKRNNNEVVEMAPVIQNPKVESVETE